jgi:hypothetical protein
MSQAITQTKVRVSRFECFHTSANWKREQHAYFYLELSRDGSKAEKAARRELAKLLEKEKSVPEKRAYHQDVEGIGYKWRVEATIIRKYAFMLALPCSVEEELRRFKRDGNKRPDEPLEVLRISIQDVQRPHVISLSLKTSSEQLRRSLDQYVETHWQSREDWRAINTYGAHVTITRGILQAFLEWFSFTKPLEEMLAEAMEIAREAAQRYKKWEDEFGRFKQAHEQYEYFYREYKSLHTLPLSKVASALEVFSLDASMASRDVIKKKYRTLAKLYHPDTLNGDEDAFKKLNNANEILMDHYK